MPSGAVLNGANEAAVAAFLDGRIRLDRIVPLVEDVLRGHQVEPDHRGDRLLVQIRVERHVRRHENARLDAAREIARGVAGRMVRVDGVAAEERWHSLYA